VSQRKPPPPVPAFEQFYREAYQPLMRDAIFAGGNWHEAEDAVSAAMTEVLQRWDKIVSPRAYARRAVINNGGCGESGNGSSSGALSRPNMT
jgi:DNA-directed RNA polymerase specialized sigma24 family protein